MNFARETLSKKIGEKAADDFIKYMKTIDNPKEVRKRVCHILNSDGKCPDYRKVADIIISEKERTQSLDNDRKPDPDIPISQPNSQPVKSKKLKFTPLFEEGADRNKLSVSLPGRHPCQCLATNHKLVNNCSGCGRIVCTQEGAGRCYFCGNLVATPEDLDHIKSNSKAGIKLKNKLLEKSWAPGTPEPPYKQSQKDKIKSSSKEFVEAEASRREENLVMALSHRDKLVTADTKNLKKNKVIDDELDYFASESGLKWLTPEVRQRLVDRVEKLKHERHASRLDSMRLSIDFSGGGRVTQYDLRDKATEELYDKNFDFEDDTSDELNAYSGASKGPSIDVENLLQNLQITKCPKTNSQSKSKMLSGKSCIQHEDFMAMVDQGKCLSMHQPWASLLVMGIKIHEGRTWYSSHRGKLWIAAGAKEPSSEDIEEVEQFYISRGVPKSLFPAKYPTGCLLGCVVVTDVLEFESYSKQFPTGESSSPFVFICEDPHELLIKYPMKGDKKIFRLEKGMHKSAMDCLV